jgi:ABC-type multidrug transport system fused ATPase/permease subunit
LPFERHIKLENVNYSYPDGQKHVLKDNNLTIIKGETVGFVGASGAGKSTLVDIILGLLEPQSGSITVDGLDIFEHLESWQKRLGYVPQSIFLLDDTIRRNIAFGVIDDEIDDARIWESIKLAGLEEVLSAMAEQLDSIVGEFGTRISGGQRQRVAIARALYRNPEVLVFDEATSALDGETERDISSAIDFISDDKTMLIVAHRLSTIRQCDMIVFMKDGKIVNTGTFEELRKIDPEFANLAKLGGQGDFLE